MLILLSSFLILYSNLKNMRHSPIYVPTLVAPAANLLTQWLIKKFFKRCFELPEREFRVINTTAVMAATISPQTNGSMEKTLR